MDRTVAKRRHVGMWSTVAAAATTLLLIAPAPAGAATGDPDVAERLEVSRAVMSTSAATTVAAAAEAQGTAECFVDNEGDTQTTTSGSSPSDPGPAANEPRADIVEHCVKFGPSLALDVQVAQPTDPETDDNWNNGTFVGWFIDIDAGDDRDGDFFVDYSLDQNGSLEAIVYDIRGDDDPSNDPDEAVQSCVAAATYTGRYSAADIRPSCIGDATQVQVSVGMFYDTNAGDSSVASDTAPDGGEFTTSAARSPRAKDRLGGAERMETSVRISQYRYPDGNAATVYLARQDLFADAVAGGVLTDGPILLVPQCDVAAIKQVTKDEVQRISPARVLALGGGNAICDDVVDAVAGDIPAGRVEGPTRIETAVAISQRQFPDPSTVDTVFLARAYDVFADAVAGGALTGGPVLLVESCNTAHQAVRDEITRLNPDTVIALGGISAICEETIDSAAQGRNTDRLAGAGRIDTAIEISKYEFPKTAVDLYITRADIFPDAVAAGVLVNGPILLVPSCVEQASDFPPEIHDEISRVAPDKVVALGGERAVCPAVHDLAAAS